RQTQRQIKSKGNAIRVSEFDLVEIAAWAQYAQVGNNAAARSNQRKSFFRRKLPLLIKPLVDGELVPLSKKNFDRLLSEVAVPGTHINHQRIRPRRRFGQLPSEPLIDRLANQVFYHRSVRHWA